MGNFPNLCPVMPGRKLLRIRNGCSLRWSSLGRDFPQRALDGACSWLTSPSCGQNTVFLLQTLMGSKSAFNLPTHWGLNNGFVLRSQNFSVTLFLFIMIFIVVKNIWHGIYHAKHLKWLIQGHSVYSHVGALSRICLYPNRNFTSISLWLLFLLFMIFDYSSYVIAYECNH